MMLLMMKMQTLDERIEKRRDSTDCGVCYSVHHGRENNVLIHMDKEYKEKLLFQVFSCQQDSLDSIKKLKEVCNLEEWEKNREKLLTALIGQGIKLLLLESEKLYGWLLEEVVNTGSAY